LNLVAIACNLTGDATGLRWDGKRQI
jgi:hypothetical protein